MLDDYPILTLLPPVLAIGLAVTTRKVLLSLGLGVVSAALLVADLDPVAGARELGSAFAQVFWVDGALNTTYVYILLFTLALGVIAAFVSMSGGTRAFADWAHGRIRSRRGALLLPAALGGAIFVDDYFNALTVGQVSRPVTDQHRVSPAKLTYLVDSTSAPVLRERLDAVLEGGAQEITVDMAAVTFLDSAGLCVLAAAYRRANGQDVRLRVLASSRAVIRPLQITGLWDLLQVQKVSASADSAA